MGPDVRDWRIKNISSRYAAAGVMRFAFLFSPGSEIPPMMNQSAEGESFATRLRKPGAGFGMADRDVM
jgi:hypothetical protein